ncbi:MAG: hypothetical protein IT373_08245 [Polyangiaceae bacterium]|nr:hypothetical protein [Polyangiaceae bacterium]
MLPTAPQRLRTARLALTLTALAGCAVRPVPPPEVAERLARASDAEETLDIAVVPGDPRPCASLHHRDESCSALEASCPAYPALRAAGIVTFTCEPCTAPDDCGDWATRVDVAVTERGRALAAEWKPATFFGRPSYLAPVARRAFVELDGIERLESGDYTVAYTYRWQETATAQALRATAPLLAAAPEGPQTSSFGLRFDRATRAWQALPRGRGHGSHAGGFYWR